MTLTLTTSSFLAAVILRTAHLAVDLELVVDIVFEVVIAVAITAFHDHNSASKIGERNASFVAKKVVGQLSTPNRIVTAPNLKSQYLSHCIHSSNQPTTDFAVNLAGYEGIEDEIDEDDEREYPEENNAANEDNETFQPTF
ncbi:hypothetical protein K3495_g4650 [Podosphaera aphanis]|nr:hypothetical protein K3495_g4650 [Podosphaera aphanis]